MAKEEVTCSPPRRWTFVNGFMIRVPRNPHKQVSDLALLQNQHHRHKHKHKFKPLLLLKFPLQLQLQLQLQQQLQLLAILCVVGLNLGTRQLLLNNIIISERFQWLVLPPSTLLSSWKVLLYFLSLPG